MKPIHVNEIKAGIFLIIATILVIAVLLQVTGTLELLTRETFVVKARFNNVIGIAPMAKVTVNGVKVGRVTDIQVVEESGQVQVELTLELDPEVSQLYEDARAYITAETFLSEKHIDLSPGSPERRRLAQGAVIPGVPAADLNETLAKLDETIAAVRGLVTDEAIANNIRGIFEHGQGLVADLRTVTADVKTLLEDSRPKLSTVLDNAQASSQNIKELTVQINEAVGRLQGDLEQLLTSANALLEENRSDVRATVQSARSAVDKLSVRMDTLLQDLAELSRRLNETVDRNQEDVQRMVQNLQAASDNARQFTKRLADYPWQLIYPMEKRRDASMLFPSWEPISASPEGSAGNLPEEF